MPKPSEEEITRLHLHLFTKDLKLLQTYFGDNIGISPAVRQIVRSWLITNNILLEQRPNKIEDMVV